MALTNKTRLGKRKLEMQELRKEKQVTTSKKHDKKCIDNKSDKEYVDWELKFKDLQEKYDKMLDDNKTKIDDLESKIKILEEEKKIYDSQPKIARTTTGELILFCNECEFPADDLFDLGQHMYECHTDVDEGKVNCHYCDETFVSKDSAMKHRKEAHKEKVRQCIYFNAGKCNYSDKLCWFIHNESKKNHLDEMNDIKCKNCDEGFKLRSEFMHHRKKHHPDIVPFCTNFLNGNCEYLSCWFKHSEHEESPKEQNSTKNLENMMEKFAERLLQSEQILSK